MESVSAGSSSGEDSGKDAAGGRSLDHGGKNPLENSEVIRKVLEFLPFQDLLSASEVNKKWKFEARSVMRQRTCILKTGQGDFVGDLKRFREEVDRFRINLSVYNGLKIIIRAGSTSSFAEDPEPYFRYILDEVKIKFLTITVVTSDGIGPKLINFALRVLLKNMNNMEEFHVRFGLDRLVEGKTHRREAFSLLCVLVEGVSAINVRPTLKMPMLHTLVATAGRIIVRDTARRVETLLTEIVTGAPRLKEVGPMFVLGLPRRVFTLQSGIPRKAWPFVRKVSLLLPSRGSPVQNYAEIAEFAEVMKGLYEIDISNVKNTNLSEVGRSLALSICKKSSKTLKKLTIPVCIFNMLKTDDCPSMERVKEVELVAHTNSSSLTNFPELLLTRMCPEVSELILRAVSSGNSSDSNDCDCSVPEGLFRYNITLPPMEGVFVVGLYPHGRKKAKARSADGNGRGSRSQGNVVVHAPQHWAPWRGRISQLSSVAAGQAELLKLRSVKFSCCTYDWAAFLKFTRMAPNVRELEIEGGTWKTMADYLPTVFHFWPGLTSLVLRSTGYEHDGSLDAVFLGIYPDEVQELYEMESHNLKFLNVVPIQPAITNLTALKKLHIICPSAEPRNSRNPTPVLKELAFGRMRNLTDVV